LNQGNRGVGELESRRDQYKEEKRNEEQMELKSACAETQRAILKTNIPLTTTFTHWVDVFSLPSMFRLFTKGKRGRRKRRKGGSDEIGRGDGVGGRD
jgi:uncharacterized membrane protein